MQLQGVPTNLVYSFETERCTLTLRVGDRTYQLYADGAVGQRMLRQLRRDTSGVTVTLNPNNPHEITAFAIIL